jgi:hypothetical protein
MRTTIVHGERFYVADEIQQSGGGVRLLCSRDRRTAEEAAALLLDNPANRERTDLGLLAVEDGEIVAGPVRDWIIVETTGARWPGILSFRGPSSRRGYSSPEEATARLSAVAAHYAAKPGINSYPSLRVKPRY